MFCIECGNQVSENAKFCRSCGKPMADMEFTASTNISHAVSPPNQNVLTAVAVAPAREAEITFLQKDGARVTSTRFIVPGQTYAMAGVTSVRFQKIEPKRVAPAFLCLLGILCLFFSESRSVGVVLVLGGFIWLMLLKTHYAVALNSASGEVRAIESTNAGYIDSIVHALNEAIVYRR